MRQTLAAFAVGLLFGLGLTISQMISPAKVLGFLDIAGAWAGAWDPSLALVMASALGVTALGYRFVLARPAPLLARVFALPTRRDLDTKLIAGSALFGIGWGLAGFCPGPAITGLGLGRLDICLFVGAMLVGMALHRLTAPKPAPA